jgi:phage portal protein BeeE
VANLLRSLIRPERAISTVDDYADLVSTFMYDGNVYGYGWPQPHTTYGNQPVEAIGNSLEEFARNAYAANGIVFACLSVRMLVFSQIKFMWQRLRDGRPQELFGSAELKRLDEPWPGGTTQDMLASMILDADLAGNAYWAVDGQEMIRLRPDWVQIILEKRTVNGGHGGWKKLGYVYQEGGINNGNEPVAFLPDQVMHFAPQVDPLATYRGMSWLQPVLREISNDRSMMRHKSKFFENAATPNLAVTFDKEVSREAFEAFVKAHEARSVGVDKAYKTMMLAGGADVKTIGADFKAMDFTAIQGHGETRVAAAAGVPPIIVGFSEGLQSATYSNYGQARRRFADGTMHPLWENAAGSFGHLIKAPSSPILTQSPEGKGSKSGVRLWYESRDIPFLREDRLDAANIQNRQAQTIRALVEAGFTPDSVRQAVDGEDWRLLEHTGMFSVQLWPPGVSSEPTAEGASGAGAHASLQGAKPSTENFGVKKTGKPPKPDKSKTPGDANTPAKRDEDDESE